MMDNALALLRLQLEWGADEALDLGPLDRLRSLDAPVSASVAAPLSLHPVAHSSAVSAGTMAQPRLPPPERAAALAGQANTLDALREVLLAFDGCALRDTASNLVFAEGDPASTTLVIGDPPGREEDRSGHCFVGADGALLDQMLAAVALHRTRLMLAPLMPWRPPGGRPASANEVAICLPFLHRLIVLLNPRRLVLFGASAPRALLAPTVVRRRPTLEWRACRVPGLPEALPTLSLPSLTAMQKTLPLRREAWAGLRLLRRAIDSEMT